MSDYKKASSAYTKIKISHPHMLLIDDQTTPLLLFRQTNKNCYINIYKHAETKVIASSCTFLYYDNITVYASLVTINDFFFLLNIQVRLNSSVKCITVK